MTYPSVSTRIYRPLASVLTALDILGLAQTGTVKIATLKLPLLRHLAEEVLQKLITAQNNNYPPAPSILHLLFQVTKSKKMVLLKSLVTKKLMTRKLVFTKTKHKAKSLALHLLRSDFSGTAIHGNLSQSKRQQATKRFRNGTFKILVTTDIAPRGIDVTCISHIVNYDVLNTVEFYTHRTGRTRQTGRENRSGEAFAFASHEDSKMVALIERNPGYKMNREPIPWLSKRGWLSYGEWKKWSIFTGYNNKKEADYSKSGKKQRSKSTSFDFGTGRREQR